MENKQDFITPENLQGEGQTVLSPSGKYRLLIQSCETEPGCWDYTRGRVYRVSDDHEVCDVIRNYSSFFHAFAVKGDQEYLITGESYTSQTVVNLQTGEVLRPFEEDSSHGFCWVNATQLNENLLWVDGCHWACPYEFRFYDFSNPEEERWPMLPVVSLATYEQFKEQLEKGEIPSDVLIKPKGIWSDAIQPKLNPDGTITVLETEKVYKPTSQREGQLTLSDLAGFSDEDYENDDNWDHVVDVKLTLERRGPVLVVLDEWKSDTRKREEAQDKAYEEKTEADLKRFKETDTFLKEVIQAVERDLEITDLRVGFISSSQHDRDNGEKNHWFFYVNLRVSECTGSCPVFHLQWGTIEGDTVTLDASNYHSIPDWQNRTTYPKTESGLKKALAYIKESYARRQATTDSPSH